MKTVELFCGTKSFSKVAQSRGHTTFTTDIDKKFNPDMVADILKILPNISAMDCPDIMWASPPCETFSVASIGKYWNEDHTPKDPRAVKGLEILDKAIFLIKHNKPRYFFIENPRGKMRKIIDKIFQKYDIKDYVRHTVTYCQYGDTRMKPTDIWTNCLTWKPKPICKNGDKCHVSAPRGSATGTQGIKGYAKRSVIPPAIFDEIFNNIEVKQ